jgi:hypothetical protein
MSEERGAEGGAGTTPGEARPPRRDSLLLARSPIFAVVALGLAGWLLWGLWPDVAYFASSRDPIDLGAPGAYHLDAARENRLVQVRGRLVDPLAVTVGRSRERRTVGRIAGTNLLVDKPGPPGQVDLFEGRLLPAGRRDGYEEAVSVLRKQGTPLGDRWQVLRDGERPRRGWLPVLGAALLVVIIAVNLRALLRPLLTGTANGLSQGEEPKERR